MRPVHGESALRRPIWDCESEALNVDLPLRARFEQPTIADLALPTMQRMSEMAPSEEIDRLLNSLETPAKFYYLQRSPEDLFQGGNASPGANNLFDACVDPNSTTISNTDVIYVI